MAVRIDGKLVSEKVKAEVAGEAARFAEKYGRRPGLHVILVGSDPASAVYVKNKELAAHKCGIAGAVHRMPEDSSEASILAKVEELNRDDTVDGILVQFPVPAHVRQSRILETISAAKDVDGLHAANVGKLWSGLPSLTPCTPTGCVRLLDELGESLAGKRAIVIGRSNLVGKPIAALLLGRHATVTLAHSKTVDLAERCREADIVIAAVGVPKLVKAHWVKPGAIVLDVGINRLADGSLAGDVDYAEVEPIARAITPVPGGVGPMTIAMLLQNTVSAAFARADEARPS